jgi:hypothetical protein
MRGLATIPRSTVAPSAAPRRLVQDARMRPASRVRRACQVVPGSVDGEEWVTKRELAAHLKMTTRWIEVQQRLGLPFLPCGAANRYRVSEVEAWLREYYHSGGRLPEVEAGPGEGPRPESMAGRV